MTPSLEILSLCAAITYMSMLAKQIENYRVQERQ